MTVVFWASLSEPPTILLGQEIVNKESFPKRRKLSNGATNKNLSHGWCQVCDCNAVFFHPFCKEFVNDDFGWGTNSLAPKKRGVKISLLIYRY
jgi:hypothetical protein